jgi:hypothetical protein
MSIQLLESALASIRMSQPRRAAVALEALADDYNKGFRYKEAALSDDDLLKNSFPTWTRESSRGRKTTQP